MQDLEVSAPQEQYTQQEIQTQELFLGKLKLSTDFERTLEVTERENVNPSVKKEAEFEVKHGESFSYRYTYLGKDYHGEFSAVSQEVSYNTENTLNAKYLHNGLSLERVESGTDADGQPIYKMKLNIPSSFTGAVHITTSTGEAVIFSDVDYIEPKTQEIVREPEVILENDAGEIITEMIDEEAEVLAIMEATLAYEEDSLPSDMNLEFESPYDHASPLLNNDLPLFELDPPLLGTSEIEMIEPSLFPVSDDLEFDLEEPKVVSDLDIEPELTLRPAPIRVPEPELEAQVEPEPEVQLNSSLVQDNTIRVNEEPLVVTPSNDTTINTEQDFDILAGSLLDHFADYVKSKYKLGSDGMFFPVETAMHLDNFNVLGDNPIAAFIRAIPEGDVSFFSIQEKDQRKSYMVLDSESQTFSMFNQMALSSYIFSKINENRESRTPQIRPDQLKISDLDNYIDAYENYNPKEPKIVNGYVVIRDEKGRMLLSHATEMSRMFVLFDPKQIESSMSITSFMQEQREAPETIQLYPRNDLYGDSGFYSGTSSFTQAP